MAVYPTERKAGYSIPINLPTLLAQVYSIPIHLYTHNMFIEILSVLI